MRKEKDLPKETQYGAVCDDERSLIHVYREKKELLSLPPNWMDLISIDDNPETFEVFLMKKNLSFKLIGSFLQFTINLDLSLKEIFALAIQQARIEKNSKNPVRTQYTQTERLSQARVKYGSSGSF